MLDRNPFSGTSTIAFAVVILVFGDFGDFGALVFLETSAVFFAFLFKGVVAFAFRPLRFGDFVSENSEAVGEGVEDTGESSLEMQYRYISCSQFSCSQCHFNKNASTNSTRRWQSGFLNLFIFSFL